MGPLRQLDRVSRQLLAGAWAAGAGPGDDPLTIDLDSTLCETYGVCKEGARHHGYTGQRGYHPLLAVAAGTGDVLMARLRKGRANTARGAALLYICHIVGPGKTSSVAPWLDCAPSLSRPDGARPPLTQPPRQLAPRFSPRVRLAVSYPAISLTTVIAARHRRPQ